MSQPPPLAVGLGEILWDHLPTGTRLGGAPANFAYHAGALGGNAAVVSAVGADPGGTQILDRLAALGLDASHVAIDPEHPTGAVDVRLDAAGVPAYIIHQGVAWDFIPVSDPMLDLARRADVTCFGSLAQRSPVSRDAVRAFVAATRPQSLRIFDINLRQHYFDEPVIRQSLASANVLKLNDEELPVIAALMGLPADEPQAMEALLAQFPLRLIALTRGPHGSALYTRAAGSIHPGYPAELVDTVGAGDAFTAALALGFLRGHTLDRINADANRVASYVCSQPGATPPMPAMVREAMQA